VAEDLLASQEIVCSMELVGWFLGWLDKIKEDDMNWACGK
jgi:hypothetical protein